MSEEPIYNSEFYSYLAGSVAKSARACVPLIQDLLKPQSVLDVGCGQGEWLLAFQEAGIHDILGVDGAYVREDELRIPKDQFHAHDLLHPFQLSRKFDLALCLEVGEHLPHAQASVLVESLVQHAPAVVFSAAVPGQGGVHHINEQWPWYWKELFARHKYVQLDPFRKSIWRHPDVLIYYQTNIFLFVNPSIHQALINKVGIPDRLSELTLVRTTILQELTDPGPLKRALRKVKRMATMFAKPQSNKQLDKRTGQ